MSANVFVFEGGGIRGLYEARKLERLALWPGVGHGLLADARLFAGTSTGGIIACALAAGLSPHAIVDFYATEGPKIFTASLGHEIAALWELNGPKYDNANLRAALTRAFGDRTLGDLNHDVLITTCDLTTRRPVAMTRQTHGGLPCVDACLRTSAAQVYFPPVDNHIDGGNAENNPAVWALVWMLANGCALTDIRMIDFGAGNADRPPLYAGAWGARQWLENGMLDLMLQFPSTLSRDLCASILGANFYHEDGRVDCAMDASEGLEAKLIAPADAADLSGAVEFLFKGA
jgi:patatin-like phospholipase/acyl hydrolase